MKKLSLVFLGLFITISVGCGDDPEIAKAEQIITQFKCSVTSVPEDADITVRYNFNAMQDDKDKVNVWLAHYKDGVHEFKSPISEVIQSQLNVYSSSCESLGGHLIQ